MIENELNIPLFRTYIVELIREEKLSDPSNVRNSAVGGNESWIFRAVSASDHFGLTIIPVFPQFLHNTNIMQICWIFNLIDVHQYSLLRGIKWKYIYVWIKRQRSETDFAEETNAGLVNSRYKDRGV